MKSVGIYPIKLLMHNPTPEERKVDRNYAVTSGSSSEVSDPSAAVEGGVVSFTVSFESSMGSCAGLTGVSSVVSPFTGS